MTDSDFETAVLEESKTRPVVVDFWAAWCGPCRVLGPILEKVAGEKSGEFLLAKLDVDANPMVASMFGVQGIPNVKAFHDGRLVDEFVGAYPEDFVRPWIDALMPTEADRAAAEALADEESGDLAGAEERYRAALEKEPGNAEALLGLARVLLESGDLDGAEEAAKPLLPDGEAERVLASVRLARWAADGEGPLARAKRLAAHGEWRDALDGALAVVSEEQDARAVMLDMFRVLGDEDPLTREFRAKLAAALF